MALADITVIICARDAVKTIGRAIDSIVASGEYPILLVDDYSEDDTVAVALEHGGDLVSVARPERRLGLGNARKTGIDTVDTRYAVWLDADDEYLPGRIERLVEKLEGGADLVFDAAELFDGVRGGFKRRLEIPRFLLEEGALVRLFERNYLPGSAWPAVNVSFAQSIGYDTSLLAGEDTDFLLRSVAARACATVIPEVGYRQYHYPDSLSRNLESQREAVARALKKHRYERVRTLFKACGFCDRIASWALCSMAVYRGDYATARGCLETGFPSGSDPDEILDRRGPLPVPEGWKWAFYQGTLDLLEGLGHAEEWLLRAESLRPTPEGANNLGIAHFRNGREAEARRQFSLAISRLPGYRDAILNSRSTEIPSRITAHPLRLQASRNEYCQ